MSRRPCTCGRVTSAVYDLSQCKTCWLIAHRPDYAAVLWIDDATAAGSESAPAGPQPRPRCRHRSAEPIERSDAAGNACHCEGKWLYGCDLFGTCTQSEERPGVRCCGLGRGVGLGLCDDWDEAD